MTPRKTYTIAVYSISGNVVSKHTSKVSRERARENARRYYSKKIARVIIG
jgi:hypothetical protein